MFPKGLNPSDDKPSLTACHFMCVTVCYDIKNLGNLGIKGNHRNTLNGFLFDIGDEPSSSVMLSLHLDTLHTVHLSNFSFSFQYSIQSLQQAEIFSCPNPKSFKYFFAWNVSLGKCASIGSSSLINSSKNEKCVLLHPPIHFKLYKRTIAPNLLCFVFAWSGLSSSLSKA
jgi:hypothetical protein